MTNQRLSIPSSWNLDNGTKYKNQNSYLVGEQPDELRASENNLTYQFNPVLNASTPVLSTLRLQVVGNIPVGQIVRFTANSETVELSASLTPSTNEFVTSTFGGFTYQQNTAEAIAAEIVKNIYIQNNYSVIVIDNIITITALQYGDEFDFSAITLPTNIIVLLQQNSTKKYNVQNSIDYQLFAQIYVCDGEYGSVIDKSTAEYVDTLYFSFQQSPIVFNINNLVKNYVDIQLPTKRLDTLPVLNELDKINDTKILKSYFVIWGDSYRHITNGDRKQYVVGQTSVNWVQNAAFDQLNPYQLTPYLWTNSAVPFAFMTDCPQNKEVDYNAHEYLQFIRKKATSSANIGAVGREITYNFVDGTSITQQTPINPTYANLSGNISIDVSPNNVNLVGVESSNNTLIDNYSIRIYYIFNGTTFYSQRYSYKIRRKCNEASNVLLFLNHYGAWDTVQMRGESTYTNERNVSTLNRAIPLKTNRVSTISTETQLSIKTQTETIITLNSGLISQNQYAWVESILNSPSVFIYSNEKDNKYYAVTILSSDFQFNSKTDEFSFNLTIKKQTPNNNITR